MDALYRAHKEKKLRKAKDCEGRKKKRPNPIDRGHWGGGRNLILKSSPSIVYRPRGESREKQKYEAHNRRCCMGAGGEHDQTGAASGRGVEAAQRAP